jgi:hypothetical protein
MRMNVYEWNALPGVDRRLYPLSAKRAQEFVSDGHAKFILLPSGHRAIQKLPPVEILADRAARNTLTPYGRGPVGLQNQPPRLHYPVPAIGDHRLSWRYDFMHA